MDTGESLQISDLFFQRANFRSLTNNANVELLHFRTIRITQAAVTRFSLFSLLTLLLQFTLVSRFHIVNHIRKN